MAEHSTMRSGGCCLAIFAMFRSLSAWSILFNARTVGNFSSVNAFTTLLIVSSFQVSSGSFNCILSNTLATICDVDPYPENCPCNVSTAFPLMATCRRRIEPHFSIRFPWIQRTISPLNHSMSTLGSYPLVFFPSASVVPDTSTTWMSASACLRSSRNLFPSPLPSCAPGTRPATSSSSIGTDRLPSWHDP